MRTPAVKAAREQRSKLLGPMQSTWASGMMSKWLTRGGRWTTWKVERGPWQVPGYQTFIVPGDASGTPKMEKGGPRTHEQRERPLILACADDAFFPGKTETIAIIQPRLEKSVEMLKWTLVWRKTKEWGPRG